MKENNCSEKWLEITGKLNMKGKIKEGTITGVILH